MATRVTVDPVTRIEGHLRVDVEVDGGKVTKAWASGQMWRGIETILTGRDPRDAWIFAQRICGVCTTVHAITSVRAVENALQLEIPKNAQYIRNMIMTAHAIHDHVVHFYHLSALDWVDVVSALEADPHKTAALAESLSDWPQNSYATMKQAQDRLRAFVGSGQLGIFANGYWGHPAMKLSPEVNLLAATHYLQALEVQRYANQIVSILGGKNPHIQNLAVGGVANPINLDSQSTLTLERLMQVKDMIDKLGVFIKSAYLTDVSAIGAFYADWTTIGAGITSYLSVPDIPLDETGQNFAMPGGYIADGDLANYKPIKTFGDEFFREGVKEAAKHSWYANDAVLHPFDGETVPKYTDFQDDGKYSWIKSPTFYGKPAQVGPLANVLCGVAAGHEATKRYLGQVINNVNALAGIELPLSGLHSTIGRHAARAIRAAVLHEELERQWHLLMENIGRGDTATYVRPEFPKGEVRGFGFHEAPRGVLSHWVVIDNGVIKNYQAVVPTTWNAAPRNQDDAIGPYEASLMDNPVADPERPLEVLRTVHSFDPCLACAVHVFDTDQQQVVRVKAL